MDQTTNWSVRYDKVSMTFDALLEGRRTKVLIDTGSFVTLIDSRLSAELTRARKIETSLKHIEGIGGVMKDVEGAIIIKIKVGKQEIPLKCHIVHNMAYPITDGKRYNGRHNDFNGS